MRKEGRKERAIDRKTGRQTDRQAKRGREREGEQSRSMKWEYMYSVHAEPLHVSVCLGNYAATK